MSKSWKNATLNQTGRVADAISIIDNSGVQICLVVDGDGRLAGTITDGDVRRGILRGLGLDTPVTDIMNHHPRVARPEDGRERIQRIMADNLLRQVPLVDSEGRLVGLVIDKDLTRIPELGRDNPVVLMAGGLGNRLRPLTENTPKPLLRVGAKPLLETILEAFIAFDFRNFYISVNYKAEMVKDHFGDGSNLGCRISYLEEDRRLGTAGALGLLPECPTVPLIVMNGDLLTKVNFASLLEFHREHRSVATMCVREYDFQVPYGVVNIQDHRIVGIVEKPVHSFFVNAGIYVLDPSVLHLIPPDEPFDMTQLFDRIVAAGENTAVFPIREYWLDIGRIDDFERANGDFTRIFG